MSAAKNWWSTQLCELSQQTQIDQTVRHRTRTHIEALRQSAHVFLVIEIKVMPLDFVAYEA